MKYLCIVTLFVISFSSIFAQKQIIDEDLIEQKIESVLKQLTLEEKVRLTHGSGFFMMGNINRLDIPEIVLSGSAKGVRTLGYETALQNPDGVPPGFTTSFPAGIAMAASRDIELIKKYQHIALKLSKEFNTKWVPYQKIFEEAVKHVPAAYWTIDGIHSTVAGTQLMAEAWLNVIK